jgi:NNP family nitrate/nitrite transporter-like MFS transporter
MAFLLGAGNGAVFKLVPQYFTREAGTVTGLVGAAGGLGGFFPPLVMGVVKTTMGSYTVGYLLLALVTLTCLVIA